MKAAHHFPQREIGIMRNNKQSPGMIVISNNALLAWRRRGGASSRRRFLNPEIK